MRETILKALIKNCPQGDLETFRGDNLLLSCVFIFYKRYHLMENILHCLNTQKMLRKDFEVILVEDRGGSEQGRNLQKKFSELNISYFAPDSGWGKMGFMRNYGLSKAEGKIILFLDDDTVFTDTLFLTRLVNRFQSNPSLDAVMPRGLASYSLINGKYQYHDPFFFTNRCMAYRKNSLIRLKGFDSNFIGQEDVELAIRFTANRLKAFKDNNIVYYHPPLIYHDTSKGYAVGASFAGSKHSAGMKLLIFLNGIRWLPLALFPGVKNKYMARFATGFLKGFVNYIRKDQNLVEYK